MYSVDEEVELLVNGISMGRKAAKETGRTSLKTTGAAAYLRLTADRPEIHSAFGDLAYVTVEIVDQDGCLVKWANPEVALEATGAGELITMGTANPMSEELYVGNQRKAWNGRLMAVVRSNGQAGEILLTASAEGRKAAELRLYAK